MNQGDDLLPCDATLNEVDGRFRSIPAEILWRMTNISRHRTSLMSIVNHLLSWLVIAAVAIGVFVRLDNVNRKSLWIDEVYTYNRFELPTVDRLFASLEGTALSPPYYLALWCWGRIFGVSDTTLRSLPACIGVLTLPVTYLVWRPLIGRRAAGWALALLSLSAYHVWYSLDAKMYAALWLLATLSCGSFLNALQGHARRPAWLLLYGLSTSCLPLVNYTGVAVVLVQVVFGLGLFATSPRRRPRIVGAWLVLFLAMVPFVVWLPIVWNAARYQYEVGWIVPTSPPRVPREMISLFGYFLLGHEYVDLRSQRPLWNVVLNRMYMSFVLGTLGFLTYSLIGVFRPGRWQKGGDERSARGEVLTFLALWVTLPVLGCLAYSLCIHPLWGVPRYMISSAAGLILWLATALEQRCGKRFALAVLVSVLGVNLTILGFDRSHDTRTDWRAAARSIGAVSEGIDARDRTSGPIPPGSPSRSPAQVVVVGANSIVGRTNRLTLNHAARTEGVAIETVSLKIAIASRRDFFYLDTNREWPTTDDSVPAELMPAVAEFRCRVVLAKSYYEVLGVCLAPCRRRLLEVWVCSPRDRTPSVLHDAGTAQSRKTESATEQAKGESDTGQVHSPEQAHEH